MINTELLQEVIREQKGEGEMFYATPEEFARILWLHYNIGSCQKDNESEVWQTLDRMHRGKRIKRHIVRAKKNVVRVTMYGIGDIK